MDFKEFLRTRPKYREFIILEEIGKKEEMEVVVKQHGKKTKGRLLIWNQETRHVSEHAIYNNRNGYAVLWGNRKIPLKNFK
ncbi:hypothetical protein A2U11_10120 [Fusobacterium necrophorum subsp. funduliforme]|uniref:hypothetical protein n=1 Tax=Fusobacterium necrophorum TaxID=859 RepID=UPI0007869306|nr:hypothetical protein [Fusobacterium necrophorum]KYM49769.1 hypothetical protein A2U11_10120 [Fusobacterium necrophorum subsp. funduliforme]